MHVNAGLDTLVKINFKNNDSIKSPRRWYLQRKKKT
jgi:hypothetical protein